MLRKKAKKIRECFSQKGISLQCSRARRLNQGNGEKSESDFMRRGGVKRYEATREKNGFYRNKGNGSRGHLIIGRKGGRKAKNLAVFKQRQVEPGSSVSKGGRGQTSLPRRRNAMLRDFHETKKD